MKVEQRDRLKKACGELLTSLRLKPNSVQGKSAVFTFWAGALEAHRIMEQPDDVAVLIYLSAGRLEDLVEMPV